MIDANARESKAEANAAAQPDSSTPGWLPILIGAAAIALIGCFGYYAFRYVSSSTFNDERAFRVLGEITGQFENLQTTMVSLLSLVPEKANRKEIRASYLANLDIPGLDLVQVSEEEAPAQQDPCSGRDTNAKIETRFEVSLADPERSFGIRRCLTVSLDASATESSVASKSATASARVSDLFELRGSFVRHLPAFAAQRFFDEAVIAIGTGDILAKVPNGRPTTATIELHDARADGLIVADASGLLRHAAIAEDRDDAGGSPKDAPREHKGADLPSHPVVFDDRIAGEDYRVFVVAFTPRYAMNITAAAGDAAGGSVRKFYLIGVKHQNFTQQITNALGPEGTLGITILVLLAILAWPLLSLRFSPAQDPISCFQVLAVMVSVLLIPMILAICAYWGSSYLQLSAWADRGAENYARDIEDKLITELSQSTHLLQAYAQNYQHDRLIADVAHDLCADRKTSLHPLDRQHVAPELLDWLPLHSVAALGPGGTSCGAVRNLFSPAAPQKDWLDLKDREYFKALQQQQQWRPDKLWTPLQHSVPDSGFVAQRLFNRSDGARVLQIAIPAKADDGRMGSVTSDARMYALTAGIAPPLLRFAIVNLSNGAVLFHSNDDRSLAENLLVETEQNEDLSAALRRHSSLHNLDQVTAEDHFSGRYLGETHNFYYRPVAGIPWGVVVFYPTADLGTISLQSAVASLATCMVFFVVILVPVLIVLLALPGRPDLDLLAFLWPKWEWREHYVRFAYIGTLAFVATTLLVLALLKSHATRYVCVSLAALCIAAVVAYAIARRPQQVSVQRYQVSYVWSFMLVIGFAAVLPTLWLTATYHDVSVRAYVRSELAEAAANIDERHAMIARDLQRWVPEDANRAEHYPDPWSLSALLPVPGYRSEGRSDNQRCTAWTLAVFNHMPWISDQGPRPLGIIRRTIWTAATQSNAQRINTRKVNARSGRSAFAATPLNGTQATSEATDLRCQGSTDAVAYWFRSNDGTLIKTQAGYAGLHIDTPRVDPDLLQWDTFRELMTIVSMGAGMLLAMMLLAWMVARRLFGIRMPFAGRFVAPVQGRMTIAPLLDAELALIDLAKQHPGEFTDKDATDWRAVHCETQYETMWKSLRQEEQLLLHQLAKGCFANPENQSIIERLVHLGFLKFKPWPRVSDSGFAHYARTAETEQQFAAWQKAASKNLWNRIRAPLLIVVLVVAALMMWLAGSTMQILSATLAGIATLFGYITQVTNFVRKDSKPLSN